MAPWVQRVFIDLLPRVFCMRRPKKEDDNEQHDVLTDVNVFQVPPDVDKYGFCGNRYATDYDIPGKFFSVTLAFRTFQQNIHLTNDNFFRILFYY